MEKIAAIDVDRAHGRVYEHGWQSWSPSTDHPAGGTGHRPVDAHTQLSGYRPGVELPAHGFQGEGLLAVLPAPGEPVRVYGARPGSVVPSIRAEQAGDTLVISTDRPEAVEEHTLTGSLYDALGTWASGYAGDLAIRPAPTVWCSWYQYFADVTEADILENLEAIGEHALPVEVVQLDDGWQAGLGDWLRLSDRFDSLETIVTRIRDHGRRAGIWIAPFLAGSNSELAREHPDWLLAPLGPGWHQDFYALDLTRADVTAYLVEVFTDLAGRGFEYFKLDFLYAGGLAGLDTYQDVLKLIRDTVGPEPFLLGCGAPILPSVGLVDAMRVAPDIAAHYEPRVNDMSSYSQRAASLTTVGRAWQHGRFWVNDPDCLIARPAVERREEWAEVVRRYGGLRASSDQIAALDDWGLSVTRELLGSVPPPVPFPAEAR